MFWQKSNIRGKYTGTQRIGREEFDPATVALVDELQKIIDNVEKNKLGKEQQQRRQGERDTLLPLFSLEPGSEQSIG